MDGKYGTVRDVLVPEIQLTIFINMIRMQQLLMELSLHGVQPYTTDFVWHGPEDNWYQHNDAYTCEIECDGHRVLLHISYNEGAPGVASNGNEDGSWDFAFFVRDENGGIWTTLQNRGTTKGAINTLRFFKTIGLALRDFVDSHHSINIINITGSDSTDAKSLQKSRVYAGFLESNPELADYRVMRYGSGRVYLIRKNREMPIPDASGIDTPNNPKM